MKRPAFARRFPAQHSLGIFAVLAAVTACPRPPGSASSPDTFRAAVSGSEWELHELRGTAAPVGAGGRRATIVFDADTARVAGFAGCNRYFSSYTLDGEALRFGPVGMTKMACTDGMGLEQQLATALEATRRYEVSDRELTLFDDATAVAKFIRPAR